MSHYYPRTDWKLLTLKQLNGLLVRIPDLHQVEMTPLESMVQREMLLYRLENNI
jgi:hypothetical protein